MRKFRGAPKEIEKKNKEYARNTSKVACRRKHLAGRMRRPFEKRQNGDGPQKRRSPNPSPSLCLPRARRKAARRRSLSSSPRRAPLRRISEATGRRILPIPVKWRRFVRLQAVLPFKLYFPKRFVAWAVSPILGASARRRARRGVEAFLRERTMRWRIRPGLILKSSAMGPKGAFSLARFVFFFGGGRGLSGSGGSGRGAGCAPNGRIESRLSPATKAPRRLRARPISFRRRLSRATFFLFLSHFGSLTFWA